MNCLKRGILILLLLVIQPVDHDCLAWCDQDPPSALKVYPESIQISENHPGQLLVYRENADGSLIYLPSTDQSDVTGKGADSERLRISVQDPTIAEVTPDLLISFLKSGSTIVTVSLGEQNQSTQITAVEETPITFTREVSAVIGKSGCNLGTCHGSLHGKAGLRLSLRGDDLAFDFDRIANEFGGRRIDPVSSTDSLLLLKASGAVAHQGGMRFGLDSESYQIMKQWIEAGATMSMASPVVRLQVIPEQVRMDNSQRQARLLVIATFADGSARDVTRWARMEPSIPDGATISEDGVVTVNKAIDLSISATYLNGRSASRLAFLGNSPTKQSIAGVAPQRVDTPHPIDALVETRLTQMRIPIADTVDDSTFLRRIHLVTAGRLPTSDEARRFLECNEVDKRDRLVDRLLAEKGFHLTWSLRWSDLLRNEDKVMSSKGTAVFHQWLTDQIACDRPWNQWTAELISSIGSTYENPPASFHRTHRDPMTAAESIGQVFLGVRIQYAKCHNHPFDSWRQDDYYGLSAYFSTIGRKQIDNNPKDKLDSHEITGDEIISLEKRTAEIYHPGLSKKVGPSPLRKSVASPASVERSADETPLTELASWLTNENEMFDRNMANRIWFQYFGVGIVDPPDDFRESNPPSNPELLDFLAKEFRQSGYSLRHLSRLILTSQTFARQAATQREDTLDDSTINGTPLFANYRTRRLSAETLIDAISAVTDVRSDYPAANTPEIVAHQAMAMPGIPKGPGFLKTFGKPNRLLICECERSNQVSLVQSLALANGPEVQNKITSDKNALGRMLGEDVDPEKAIEEIYMSALARPPRASEWQTFRDLLSSANSPRAVLEDVLWAVINSKEFVMIR